MEKIDFDQLCKNAYSPQAGLIEKDKLWIEIFKMKEWYFIPRGSRDNIHPYIAEAKEISTGKQWVHAFTDMDRATFFVKRNGLFMEDNTSPIMVVPNNQELLEWLNEMQDEGVFGIYFNADGGGFYSPIDKLDAIKSHLQKTYPKDLK
ncbi:hypothetical protein K6119_14500 [Paracrocinitomix mangrovi]|uniref:hypothetical protein n=1 Tax=Paracrocinitomix mangrovi TaxID=2862509 RepID=UPI001C8E0B5A|nr:hypothetical protein [Paracrocinitomix mangrovi]UKN00942.1 hypothetical protein K6119_14500 [Paracrocinitomix mangrovi]